MFALIKVAESTYYIQNPSKIGIYVEPDGSATVIDAGMGDSAGERVVKILDKNGWKCARIINTHAHVDHVGGDRAIIAATGVSAYVPEPEIYTGHNPFMEPSAMYGGYPFDRVRERYGEPHIAPVKGLGELELPAGFAIARLDGHCGAMAAIKTPDDVWFVGDAVIDPAYLESHGIAYNWNIAETLDSIEKPQGQALRAVAHRARGGHRPSCRREQALYSCGNRVDSLKLRRPAQRGRADRDVLHPLG